jgi:copper chaperone
MSDDTRVYNVPDISCGHCKQSIETEVGALEGVDSAVVDVDERTVSVAGNASDAEVEAAIREAGFEIASA